MMWATVRGGGKREGRGNEGGEIFLKKGVRTEKSCSADVKKNTKSRVVGSKPEKFVCLGPSITTNPWGGRRKGGRNTMAGPKENI